MTLSIPAARHLSTSIDLPSWVEGAVDWNKRYLHDEEKMSLALTLSELNYKNQTGGPFGSAIFDSDSGALLGVGVNRVLPLKNSVLHGEIIAIMLAERTVDSFSLGAGSQKTELFTSCEPCAMCLGATLWSGVSRLVCSAAAEDARAIGFDEGPVFDGSYDYLINAGVRVQRYFMRERGKAILRAYSDSGGAIYNGRP
jgi:tRNA(Arg) A34 adenosine deaminase TadA